MAVLASVWGDPALKQVVCWLLGPGTYMYVLVAKVKDTVVNGYFG